MSDLIAERTGRLPLLSADPKSAVVLGALAALPQAGPPGPEGAAAPAYAGGRVRRYLNPDGDLGFRFTPRP